MWRQLWVAFRVHQCHNHFHLCGTLKTLNTWTHWLRLPNSGEKKLHFPGCIWGSVWNRICFSVWKPQTATDMDSCNGTQWLCDLKEANRMGVGKLIFQDATVIFPAGESAVLLGFESFSSSSQCFSRWMHCCSVTTRESSSLLIIHTQPAGRRGDDNVGRNRGQNTVRWRWSCWFESLISHKKAETGTTTLQVPLGKALKHVNSSSGAPDSWRQQTAAPWADAEKRQPSPRNTNVRSEQWRSQWAGV